MVADFLVDNSQQIIKQIVQLIFKDWMHFHLDLVLKNSFGVTLSSSLFLSLKSLILRGSRGCCCTSS